MRAALMILAPMAIGLATVAAAPAPAPLAVGSQVADFQTRGAVAGKDFALHLKAELKKGPLVLYFFPAAFTPGCSAEAQAFAKNIDNFHKLGVGVVGMSADPVEKLRDFSMKDCAGQFPVASAGPSVISNYHVGLTFTDANGQTKTITNRTSYLIGPNGQVIAVHSNPSAADHVQIMLAAAQKYRVAHP